MEVSDKNFLLQGPYIGVQEMKPMLLVFNLDHVDVSRWHVLISTLKSGILQSQTAFVQFLNISLNPSGSNHWACIKKYIELKTRVYVWSQSQTNPDESLFRHDCRNIPVRHSGADRGAERHHDGLAQLDRHFRLIGGRVAQRPGNALRL